MPRRIPALKINRAPRGHLPRFLLASLAASLALCAHSAPPPIEGLRELHIGDPAPDFCLPGIDGKTHTLADYQDAKILVVAFISNHCPASQAVEGRLKQFVSDLQPRGVALVAINPNNPGGLRIDELGYSKYGDSFEEMKLHAAEQGFNFPYLYDGTTQGTAKAYGCLATPHVFVFDAGRKLRYKGAFDDSRFPDPATVKSSHVRDAVEALLAGRPVPAEETRPHGCSTKWMEKQAAVTAEIEQWQKEPVDVEPIDAAGVAALRQNGTPKFRLFNVWATWCGPCVEEFPELVQIARRFSLREFELITISLDDPRDPAKVKAFLEKHHASLPGKIKATLAREGRTTNSYIFNGPDQGELIRALDPDWPGPIPHTVLVAPDGRVLWNHNGAIDGAELRAKILEFMGRFHQPR